MRTKTREIHLDSSHSILRCRLAGELYNSPAVFDQIWLLHPAQFPGIFLHGRDVPLPRWQQAYGRSYFFSGKTSSAKPIPGILLPYLSWCQRHLDKRLNGMLLNWYDGQAGHYIGAHRDSTRGLLTDSPIVMISLGGARVMRFRPVNGSGFTDFDIDNGDVIIMPWFTNSKFKHEVPGFKRHMDKRISITLRCFE